MKSKLFILVFLFTTLLSYSQQGINYKALIKDNGGNVVANQNITVQFIILQNAVNVYQETHNPTTDANGIIIINIGEGTTSDVFEDIDWGSDDHFLNVQINTGSGLTDMGTTQFKAVPYALYAETAGSGSNATGLEAIDEGNGVGWRLTNSPPENYGDIGYYAVDLSISTVESDLYGATGLASFASGAFSQAFGGYSTALGHATVATGDNSISTGYQTEASGFASTAFGSNTTASEAVSTAFGLSTLASGNYSTAMGYSTVASGNRSIAMGDNTEASGYRSTAMGYSTVASGNSSTAIGDNTVASGNYSTAIGNNTVATSSSSTVVGMFNVDYMTDNTLFQIGNGLDSENRNNALEVYKNGSIFAPSLNIAQIIDPKALITKEYLEANISAATGLEALDEGNGVGWRLIGRDPTYYGNIGENAVDFSYHHLSGTSTTRGATGQRSTAMGSATTASGSNSTALGANTEASGSSSTALGANTEASGFGSISMGVSTMASGDYSSAFGYNTIANQNYAMAMGRQTLASGDNGTAIGYLSTASGLRSTAMGYDTEASGENATALGYLSDASGYTSIAAGTQSIASGSYATAIGNNAEANYTYAVAIGNSVLSSGNASVAMGTNTTASGAEAFAMGNANTATGGRSVALGYQNNVTSDYSFAMGNNVEVSSFAASAIGYNLINDDTRSMVIGQNNDNTTTATSLFMIGNGGSTSSRSNAFTVFQNGNATLAGALTQNSDRRLKQDINELDYGLNEIMKLKPVSYHWKKYPEQPKSLGLIAQDIQPIIKEIVHVGEDKDNTLSVSYTELIPVLIKAIQEQQVIIESQKLTINNQEQASTEQSALLQALLDRVEALEKRSVTADFKLVKN